MFERALRSWGRLLGREEAVPTAEEDRRVWVRYPCNLEATLQAANPPHPERLAARVRDVSRGGMQLVVDRRFEPGSVLSVDLPGAGEIGPSSVLAYVVRVAAQGEGAWAVGCTFACELSDTDLKPLGARRVKRRGSDQRSWVRFPTQARASYRLVRKEAGPFPAEVADLSPGGVGLLVGEAVDVGALLSVELRDARDEAALTMMASVVRVTPQANGAWGLGCNFIRELTDHELGTFR